MSDLLCAMHELQELRTFGSKRLARIVPPKEMKKLLPLGLLFFCVVFSYTILRNTKDVLVVTAPGAGAEVIPFLKTYVQLPGAIAFTVLYSKMCNTLTPNKVTWAFKKKSRLLSTALPPSARTHFCWCPLVAPTA